MSTLPQESHVFAQLEIFDVDACKKKIGIIFIIGFFVFVSHSKSLCVRCGWKLQQKKFYIIKVHKYSYHVYYIKLFNIWLFDFYWPNKNIKIGHFSSVYFFMGHVWHFFCCTSKCFIFCTAYFFIQNYKFCFFIQNYNTWRNIY